jgi:hypothetical protein
MDISRRKSPDFTPYTKSAIIGPGVWFSYHLKSFNIITIEDVDSYLRDIDLLRRKFSCLNCRNHFNEFCNIYPPEREADKDKKDIEGKIRRPEHLARWTVDSHTAANEKKFEWMAETLGTETYSPDEVKYEDVRSFFDSLGDTPCIKDCDKPEVSTKKVSTVTSTKITSPTKKPEHDWNPQGTRKPVIKFLSVSEW